MYVSKKDHETVIALEKNMYFIMKTLLITKKKDSCTERLLRSHHDL